MKLHFLGTGSSYPTTKRGVSATILQLDDGTAWLFDCGEGTQIQAQKVAVSRQRISKIFITHLHGDHLFGLPGLMCTISSQIGLSVEEIQKKGAPVIDIYGPQGLRNFVLTALSLSRSPLLYQFKIHEMVPVSAQYPADWDTWPVDHTVSLTSHPSELTGNTIHPSTDDDGNVHWKLFDNNKWMAEAGWIHHRIPTFGFILMQKDRPGTLDKKKLMDLGVKPGPIYGRLKNGENITLDDGRCVTPSMVMGNKIPGRTLVILGDTNDASPLAHLVSSCDVLVHEATHDDNLREKAAEFGHSTPSEAVEFAKRVNAKTLLLNHFSQRYGLVTDNAEKDDDEETVAVLERQAVGAADGTLLNVKCTHDLFVYEIPPACRALNK